MTHSNEFNLHIHLYSFSRWTPRGNHKCDTINNKTSFESMMCERTIYYFVQFNQTNEMPCPIWNLTPHSSSFITSNKSLPINQRTQNSYEKSYYFWRFWSEQVGYALDESHRQFVCFISDGRRMQENRKQKPLPYINANVLHLQTQQKKPSECSVQNIQWIIYYLTGYIFCSYSLSVCLFHACN